MIGEVRDVSRFAGRDHFAAYDGIAPIEVSSGNRKVYRLSRRGNRRINRAIHMAAVTQVRHPHSKGPRLLRPEAGRGQDRPALTETAGQRRDLRLPPPLTRAAPQPARETRLLFTGRPRPSAAISSAI